MHTCSSPSYTAHTLLCCVRLIQSNSSLPQVCTYSVFPFHKWSAPILLQHNLNNFHYTFPIHMKATHHHLTKHGICDSTYIQDSTTTFVEQQWPRLAGHQDMTLSATRFSHSHPHATAATRTEHHKFTISFSYQCRDDQVSPLEK